MQYNINDHVEVYDAKTSKLIVAGKIVDYKLNYYLHENFNNVYDYLKFHNASNLISVDFISFNNTIFFNANSKNFAFIKTTNTQIVDTPKFEQLNITYSCKYWRDMTTYNDRNTDIIREFSIDELDLEVIPLCNVINSKLKSKTISSCSGHNNYPLNIVIEFKSFDDIKIIMDAINNDAFKEKFLLVNDNRISYDKNIIMTLYTIDIGKSAYLNANLLAEYLNTVV